MPATDFAEPVLEAVALRDSLREAESRLERDRNRDALRPVLAELPRLGRTLLLLRLFGSLTHTQIARQTGLTRTQVAQTLAVSLSHVRDRLP